MTLEEFLDRIDEIMCGTSNAERAYLEDLYDEVTKPHWISVADELPKIDWTMSDTVVVTDGSGGLRLAWYHQDEGWHFATGLPFEPTHWMPLPQPPVVEVRTIYDVMADESHAIATEDEKGGENG